jgi:hypothetical protein
MHPSPLTPNEAAHLLKLATMTDEQIADLDRSTRDVPPGFELLKHAVATVMQSPPSPPVRVARYSNASAALLAFCLPLLTSCRSVSDSVGHAAHDAEHEGNFSLLMLVKVQALNALDTAHAALTAAHPFSFVLLLLVLGFIIGFALRQFWLLAYEFGSSDRAQTYLRGHEAGPDVTSCEPGWFVNRSADE